SPILEKVTGEYSCVGVCGEYKARFISKTLNRGVMDFGPYENLAGSMHRSAIAKIKTACSRHKYTGCKSCSLNRCVRTAYLLNSKMSGASSDEVKKYFDLTKFFQTEIQKLSIQFSELSLTDKKAALDDRDELCLKFSQLSLKDKKVDS